MTNLKQLNDHLEALKIIIKKDEPSALEKYLINFDWNSRTEKGQNIIQFMIDAYNWYIPMKCCEYLFLLEKAKPLVLELDHHGNNTIYQLFFQDCFNYNLVKTCLDLGCDINQLKKHTAENLLHCIALQDNNDLFDLVMERGININHIESNKRTVLHYVLTLGKTSYICQQVIEKIDDNLIHYKDDDNKTALDYLEERIKKGEHQEMLVSIKELLQKKIEKLELEKKIIDVNKTTNKQKI